MFGLMFNARMSGSWPCRRPSGLRSLPHLTERSSSMVMCVCVCVQSSDSHWLPTADRDQQVMELKTSGWVEVEERDAIFKELHFKTFNQVCVCVCVRVCVRVLRTDNQQYINERGRGIFS
uniref:4a-hydroxytetrahydrobiopterin dehydratase n=1 Tax=Gasterosteus aculeatus aculeatus TaxID=481459 RepID=A0AAQ4Q9U5_GASAC